MGKVERVRPPWVSPSSFSSSEPLPLLARPDPLAEEVEEEEDVGGCGQRRGAVDAEDTRPRGHKSLRGIIENYLGSMGPFPFSENAERGLCRRRQPTSD